jgi:hypothetical protein
MTIEVPGQGLGLVLYGYHVRLGDEVLGLDLGETELEDLI